jgi:hypothetical protein
MTPPEIRLQFLQTNAAVRSLEIEQRTAAADGSFQVVFAQDTLHLHFEIR